jgi:hypothetical protein
VVMSVDTNQFQINLRVEKEAKIIY